MRRYIDALSLNEFEQILLLYDILLDRKESLKLLRCLRANYELMMSEHYGQLLDMLIHLSEHQMTLSQAHQLVIHFKYQSA